MKTQPCAVPECEVSSRKGRWCGPHSMLRVQQPGDKPCASEFCDRAATAKGVCGSHYNLLRLGQNIHRALQDPTQNRRNQWVRSSRGYVYMNTTSDGTTKTLFQHRVVMEEYLNRPLIEGENVHHINGVRDDNRIENLELWNTGQPAGQRVADKVAWAKEILALYEGSFA